MFDDQKPRNRLLEAQNRHQRPIIDPQKPKIELQRAKISSQWPKIESRRPKMDPYHRGQNWLPELQKRIPDTQNWLPDAKINSQCLKSTPICSKLIPRDPKSSLRAKINKKNPVQSPPIMLEIQDLSPDLHFHDFSRKRPMSNPFWVCYWRS